MNVQNSTALNTETTPQVLIKGDKVQTCRGDGVYLGWECFKVIGRKEVYSIQDSKEGYGTTNRKVVKMDTGETLCFFEHDLVTKIQASSNKEEL